MAIGLAGGGGYDSNHHYAQGDDVSTEVILRSSRPPQVREAWDSALYDTKAVPARKQRAGPQASSWDASLYEAPDVQAGTGRTAWDADQYSTPGLRGTARRHRAGRAPGSTDESVVSPVGPDASGYEQLSFVRSHVSESGSAGSGPGDAAGYAVLKDAGGLLETETETDDHAGDYSVVAWPPAEVRTPQSKF